MELMQKLESLISRKDKAKEEKNRLQGRIEEVNGQLTSLGVQNDRDAEAMIVNLRKEYERKMSELRDGIESAEKEFDWEE